jgi:hypothetical protein
VGVALEALEECVHSYKVFSQRAAGVRGVCFSRPRRYFSRPRRCHVSVLAFACIQARLGGVALRRAPKFGPTRDDQGELSGLSVRPFAALSLSEGVRCPRLPSSGSRIMDPSLSY